jgi:Outer membrane protein beta-barrel domain
MRFKHKLTVMKKILLSIIIFSPLYLLAQPKFDLGIKGGVNFSKVSLNAEDYGAESVTKTHFGAFGRIGWSRIFIQPELYYSGKGGDVASDITGTLTSFDFSTFDVPVLLGFSVIKSGALDIHLLAGPVFSNISYSDVSGGGIYDESLYTDRYTSIQYGLGIDVWFINLSARMENGMGSFYKHNGNEVKNNALLISVGFKFL